MKVLYLNAYFYPEDLASSYLGHNVREALAKADVDIVLYAPTPSRGVSEQTRKQYSSTKKNEVWYDGRMHIHRFSLFKEGKNPLLRAFRYFLVIIKLYNQALFDKDAKNSNVMFIPSTPPIMGIMAARIKKRRKIPFVYILQDIFPDSLVGTGLTRKGSLLWKIGRLIENYTYKYADKIIVISQDFKRNIMAKGVPEEKIEVVYNWVDQNAVVDVSREKNKLFDKYKLDRNKFYLTYSGNIGLTQNMDMLLDVMEDLQKEVTDIHLVLIGEGAYKKQVEEIVANKNLNNVTMLPFQPYEDISYVFSLGDAGLVISKPGVGSNSVPSKTWSIMSASRPVLANFDENELKTIIADNNCGIFTKAGDKEAFKEAILKLYGDKELCKEMGRNGRQFVMDNLTREVGTRKYVEVIKFFDKK